MKKNIVGLMLKTPESIQRQLSDAIAFIGEGRGSQACGEGVCGDKKEGGRGGQVRRDRHTVELHTF